MQFILGHFYKFFTLANFIGCFSIPWMRRERLVFLIDSLGSSSHDSIHEQVASLLRCQVASFQILMKLCPKQQSCPSCGINANANMVEFLLNPAGFIDETLIGLKMLSGTICWIALKSKNCQNFLKRFRRKVID